MCLSVPGQIIEIKGNDAKVSVGGAQVTVSVALLEGVKIGDYVIVHAGIALQIISDEDAKEMLDLIAACSE